LVRPVQLLDPLEPATLASTPPPTSGTQISAGAGQNIHIEHNRSHRHFRAVVAVERGRRCRSAGGRAGTL